MRWIGLALAALVVAGSARPALAATPGPLDGEWNIVQRAYTPTSTNSSLASSVTSLGWDVVVSNGQITCQDSGGNSFSILVTVSGQNVDFGYVGTQYDLPGIYKIDGNVITIALSFTSTRPTGYDDTTNYMVIVLTQVSH
jgi:hypothetical protein